MTTLYELTDDLLAAHQDLNELLGNEVITQETYDDSLAAILDRHKVKTTGVIAFIKNILAEEAAYTEEIKKLQKRLKSATRKAEFYKGYLMSQLIKLDKVEAGDGIHTCKIKDGSLRCEIVDENIVPSKFVKEKITKHIDKQAITEEIKAGNEVEGAALVPGPSKIKID